MPFDVVMYQSPRGEKLVKNFIDKLDIQTQSKIYKTINLLINYGPLLCMPVSKKINKNLHELRTKGVEKIRILYCHHNNEYILLHIFKKKSKKIPAKEIKLSLKRLTTIT